MIQIKNKNIVKNIFKNKCPLLMTGDQSFSTNNIKNFLLSYFDKYNLFDIDININNERKVFTCDMDEMILNNYYYSYIDVKKEVLFLLLKMLFLEKRFIQYVPKNLKI
jgi:hypothetical protein